jgi:hypothetical protein
MLPFDAMSRKSCTFFLPLPPFITLAADTVPRWRLSAIRKEYAQKGLSPPNEETAGCQCLGQDVPAPDLITVKDSIRFCITISKPQCHGTA